MTAAIFHDQDEGARAPRYSRQLLLTPEQQGNLLTNGWDALEAPYRPPEKVSVGDFQVDRRQLKLFGAGAVMCMSDNYSLALVHKATGQKVRAKFRCKSSRCLRCEARYYQRLRNRMKLAVGQRDPNNLVFAVLTLNQRRDLWNDRKTATDSYALVYKKWKVLKQNLDRNFGVSAYCCVLEAHETGAVHVNVLIESAALAETVRERANQEPEATIKPLWWRRIAKRAGFGTHSSVEVLREGKGDNLAAYLSKICEDQTSLVVNEVSKSRQRPGVKAPLGTRLVRPSRNWFQKEQEEPSEYEGQLQRLSYEEGLIADSYEAFTEEEPAECRQEAHTESAATAASEGSEPEQLAGDTGPALSLREALLSVTIGVQLSKVPIRPCSSLKNNVFTPTLPAAPKEVPCVAGEARVLELVPIGA